MWLATWMKSAKNIYTGRWRTRRSISLEGDLEPLKGVRINGPAPVAPLVLLQTRGDRYAVFIDDQLLAVSYPLGEIEHGHIFAGRAHEHRICRLRDLRSGEIGVALHDLAPRLLSL